MLEVAVRVVVFAAAWAIASYGVGHGVPVPLLLVIGVCVGGAGSAFTHLVRERTAKGQSSKE
jgi:hypothetical protein